MNELIIESTGNVFADLGFDPGEAAILQIRAKLLNDLRAYVESAGMTRAEIAEQFGLGHSRVLDLISGKWEKFSLEMLIMLQAKAGKQVQLELV